MMTARRKAKVSRRDAAEKLGVSESAINAYEQGRSDPSARVLVMMAWLYRVRIERLVRPREAIQAEYDETAETAAPAGPGDDDPPAHPRAEEPAA